MAHGGHHRSISIGTPVEVHGGAMVAGELPSPVPAPPQQHVAVYLGLSCALAAVRVASGSNLGGRQCRWSRLREAALRGKVDELELQVRELRRRRAEDARANEKVAAMFAAHKQRWFVERKALRRHVETVVAAAQARELKHDDATAELTRQLEINGEAVDQEIERRVEVEEKLRASELATEELREHAGDLRKHEAAFVELASAQRQLEAELSRAVLRLDSAEVELKAALERRDEAVATAAELTEEAARLRRDAEHKDKILSAMLRKCKIDMDGRVKTCKARRKLEAERWRSMWECRHRRGCCRSSGAADHPASCSCSDDELNAGFATNDRNIVFVDRVEAEGAKERQGEDVSTVECVNGCASRHVDDKPVVEEYEHLQEWFHVDTGNKYTSMMTTHRHNAETAAFTDQLRLKDEKALDAFRRRVVTMDAEAARLRCRVQELEATLMSRRRERHGAGILDMAEKEKENAPPVTEEQIATAFDARASVPATFSSSGSDGGGRSNPAAGEVPPLEASSDVASQINAARKQDRCKNGATEQSSCRSSEIEEEKEVCTDPGAAAGSSCSQPCARSRRTVDIHALAVSYKIKRLKQQLVVLESLAGGGGGRPRSYSLMISFVSKHVKRYQSLEEKIDELTTRMEESKRSWGRRGGGGTEQSEALGRFLEETFQLQRYVVATGQKLLEMQARVAATLARAGGGDDGVDTGKFMDVVGALLRDVQRGLEVRIARIIGELEGTLTFHGIVLQTAF